jgi:hypothetical protein
MRAVVIAAAAALLCGAPAVAVGHPTDPLDRDHDSIRNQDDNCPDTHNPNQLDSDHDAQTGTGAPSGTPFDPPSTSGGDACDVDDDNDQVKDELDNCTTVDNANQTDTDADGDGDACDLDDDGDGVLDDKDNCPKVANHGQPDADDDFIGDACDPDAPRGQAGPPATVSTTGTPVVVDKVAPKVTLRVGTVPRLEALGAGLPVPVLCNESCTLSSQLVASGKVVARGSAQLGEAGRTYLFVRFTRGSLKRLARTPKIRPLLRVTAQDDAGNRTVVQRRLTLRR